MNCVAGFLILHLCLSTGFPAGHLSIGASKSVLDACGNTKNNRIRASLFTRSHTTTGTITKRTYMHSGYIYSTLFWLLASTLFSPVTAMSKEQAAALKSAASKADKRITHIPAKDVRDKIARGPWLIFWGIEWCKITQRFTPKWLEFQEKLKASDTLSNLQYAKVECIGHEDICEKGFNVSGFPTINRYMNGRLVEEYLGHNEVPNLLEYVKLTMLPETLAMSSKPLSSTGSTSKKMEIKTEEPISKSEEVPDKGSFVVWYAFGGVALVIAYVLLRRRTKARKVRYSHLPYDS